MFFAGGIRACPDWQKVATAALDGHDVNVFNSSRRNFPVLHSDAETEQVGWEYRHLGRAILIMFWFSASPNSYQPIAPYELGMAAPNQGTELVVGVDLTMSAAQT
ncbi:nucleoside 2-deoxyribosyltransferase domain-containing protein [Streptomyces sp. AA1529]|uniref:nucleoside 2-deoxyribosyltransferase domain-containing protein n=1 Tax=Streptomyces sp. AA1529 TaxID=1203257 RepID=UPI003D73E060